MCHKKTIIACYIGYIVQAISNNFAPLLFLILQAQYQIPLTRITMLISVNFTIQMLTAAASALFVDRIGYRAAAVTAHGCTAAGLVCLALLPDRMGTPFIGILIAVALYAVGGGILEVIISPISEACPAGNSAYAMNILHSFYSWGSAGVIVLSTVFLRVTGNGSWQLLSLLWALLPIVNGIAFLKLPIASPVKENQSNMSIPELLTEKGSWELLLLMLCTGASEQAVCQWASAFAEKGLGVSKVLGDIAGPAMFVACMGLARVMHAQLCRTRPLNRLMFYSSCFCVLSYFLIGVIQQPFTNLLGMACCGFSIGIMWPGVFTRSALLIKRGGTAMFALLALSGDLGCAIGPTFAGYMAGLNGADLRFGITCSICFPILLTIGAWRQLSK